MGLSLPILNQQQRHARLEDLGAVLTCFLGRLSNVLTGQFEIPIAIGT